MPLLPDLVLAIRRLLKAPGHALAVVLMTTLGVALSTTMFGVLAGVLGSLPYPRSAELLEIQASHPQQGAQQSLTPVEAMALQADPGPLASFGYYVWGGMTVFEEQRPRELRMVNVSEGFFPSMAMPPLLGRWFSAEEFASSSDSVILSEAEWRRLLGGRPDAIGQRIETAAGRLRVVGVMPEAFAMPASSVGAWRALPVDAYPLDQPWVWNARFVEGICRLDRSTSPAALHGHLQAIIAGNAERHGADPSWQLNTLPLLDSIIGDIRGVLWGAFGMAVLVLLIAAANVAILADARQLARRHDHAVLQALGASRARVRLGALLETAVLTLLACALGVLLSAMAIGTIGELARGSLPRVDAIAIDGPVLGFAVALALLLPLLAAAAGGVQLHADAAAAIRAGGRGLVARARRRRWLPVIGVALSTTSLLAAAALLVSLLRLQAIDPGFRAEGVSVLQLFHGNDADTRRDFADRLQAQLQGLPGVASVAVSSAAPLSVIGGFSTDLKRPQSAEPEPYRAMLRRVSPEYLGLLGVPIVAGRDIRVDDRAGAPRVAVINQSLARRLGGEQQVLGEVLELPLGSGERVPYRVVGVMADQRNAGLREPASPEILLPFASDPVMAMSFLVRSAAPLVDPQTQFSDALYTVDPREASTRIYRLDDDLAAQLAASRFFARTVGAFALAALLLAAFGVYAVGLLQQRQRTAEFGLRLAIGARPAQLLRQVLLEASRPVLLGVLAGLGLGWLALHLLQTQLYAVPASPWGVASSGVLLVLLAAFIASLLPALRAARIDPRAALQAE